MAFKATDHFNRPNQSGLGVAETGQTWRKVRGIDATISNNKALIGRSNPGSIYVLDTGAGGGDSTIEIDITGGDGAGQSLYFRVVDPNHWWRFSKHKYEYIYQYQSGTTEPVYGYVGTGSYYYEPAGGWVQQSITFLSTSDPNYSRHEAIYSNYDTRVNAYLSRYDYNGGRIIYYQTRVVREYQNYQIIKPSEPIYSYATGQQTEVRLDRCVNGLVQTIRSANSYNAITSLRVELNKERIACFVDDMAPWAPYADGSLADASKHGIGFNERTTLFSNTGIEAFRAVPSVLSGYMPAMML